ncbi:MAG: bifunctional diaminohydroxyphosphoribosylaminopyrimidine deaminase/5-amino-6-(5-phosphoribosylamino)uracil reductase RibD [Bacteroidaceae bacterium]|nr:bifunctional diaminohydroxyphosphoribosylaminopyrimidine deaminase/5-amino-6-(5-phosphoribosylamino)uracil reductase RibD [Bacteroidaceae bacterium]
MQKYMLRCIQLARQGEQTAPPNPMVGAVIVHNDRIIGEGYHVRCGEAHAEVNAVRSVRPEDRPLLRESTIYVSLEPCAHYGKTPPCAELIIREGIPRVVVGCVDPFAKVKGKGIQMLRDAGCEVVVGVCEAECQALNSHFFTFHTHKRPYITLKWARSADGFIDACREDATQAPLLISTPETQLRAHRLRTTHQAILVGHRTLLLDKPSLTPRAWDGPAPLRLVLGNIPEAEHPEGFEAFTDIDTLLTELHRRNIQALLVEGGRQVLQSFIDRGLWDEAWEEIGTEILNTTGIPAPTISNAIVTTEDFGGHTFIHYTKK